MKYALSRCDCKVEEPPIGACPCLEGTLTDTNDLVVSGFVTNATGVPSWDYDDVNGTYDFTGQNDPELVGCSRYHASGMPEGGNIKVRIIYTRRASVRVGVLNGWTPFQQQNVFATGLPAGINAVAVVDYERGFIGFPVLNQWNNSFAIFTKRVDTDANAYIDCTVEVLDMDFHSQYHWDDDWQAFDASGGSISYVAP